jgi:serine/threonine-protein kinase SRPK3
MSLDPFPPFRYRQPRMEHVEDVEKYLPGGFHPVDIGDVIGTGNQSYEVIHKLGYGGFSTVWLVRSCRDIPSYFALKILIADVDIDNELSILQHLNVANANRGHPNVLRLYDSFKVSGPNGNHHCLVFPVLGPSLQNLKASKALSPPIRHHICQQIASAVDFLHRHGICHGGKPTTTSAFTLSYLTCIITDLTPSNILFNLPDVHSMSPTSLFELLGPIVTENLRPNGLPSPHGPKKVVQTASLSGLDYSLLTWVRIIDFGQAFFVDHPPLSLGIPIDYFSPELCFSYFPSTKTDIWQLACVLYKVQSKLFLFPTFFRIFGILIGTVVGYMGPLPQHWKGRFNFDKYGYYENGQLKNKTEPDWWYEDKPPKNSHDDRLSKEAPHLSTLQRKEFVRLLHEMVAYEPENRPLTSEVIQRLKFVTLLDK